MTSPVPPPQPSGGPDLTRRRAINKIILSVLAGVLVLCCGGSWLISTFADDPAKPTPAAGTPAAGTPSPSSAAPLLSSAPASRSATSPGPTATAPRSSAAQRSPAGQAEPRPKPAAKPTPGPAPRPTRTTAPALRTVTPGAFCKPEGARGVSKTGRPMRCTRKAGENQPRWRAA